MTVTTTMRKKVKTLYDYIGEQIVLENRQSNVDI